MRHSRRPRLRLPPCVPNDVLIGGIEWREPKLPRAVIARLRAQADRLGKMILADWLTAAKDRAAQIGKMVEQDKLWLAEEAQRAARAADAERDTAQARDAIDRMVEKDLPILKAQAERRGKQRRSMSKAIKREKQRLNEAALKLARAKVQAMGKARHR
jgi:hypothetical protein